MQFISSTYLIFLLAVFLAYWTMRRRHQNIFLLIASWFFYACWDWRFLGLIFVSTIANFAFGNWMYRAQPAPRKKRWLILSLIVNLGLLGYFKYANFFLDNFVALADSVGWHVSSVTLQITLPVGISFLTFQALSYPLDIYFGKLKPTTSLLDFAVFVAFFPKLVAGPITRAREFLFQLEQDRNFSGEDLQEGCIRLLTGYFKKAFIADTLAMYLVNPVFADPASFSAGTLWLAIIGYTVQIYADFSGYSNMAIGSARILGLRLPENFIFPYLSTGFSEFWKRWHVTMSRFFRDYVYFPLGGSRCSESRVHINLALTMLICGLWHGADWTFVFWGGLHGFFLMVRYFVKMRTESGARMPADRQSVAVLIRKWSFTQFLICLSMIPVKAADMGTVGIYLTGLVGLGGKEGIQVPPLVWACFLAAFLDHLYGWLAENKGELLEKAPALIPASVYAAMIIFLYHAVPGASNPFIYFQF